MKKIHKNHILYDFIFYKISRIDKTIETESSPGLGLGEGGGEVTTNGYRPSLGMIKMF